MTCKNRYIKFCENTYTPIYSKPWWMDAVCGEDNWDVWLYEINGNIEAAMPYYLEKRGKYRYITKAPLTQNNGIIFKDTSMLKECSRANYEEKVINKACEFIAGMGLDVYEQQYQTSFKNWLPFFWNYYTAITRYTYVIEDTSDLNTVWDNISSKYRNKIKKGRHNTILQEGLTVDRFYKEHEKIFFKQGLECPFSFVLWKRLYDACAYNNTCKILYRTTKDGDIASLMFLVWDEKRVYQLLAGSVPEFQKLDSYDALIWDGIEFAHNMGLKYDFEGSVIKRISKSFREFGGIPERYYRIRKIFNPEIMKMEYEQQIKTLFSEL